MESVIIVGSGPAAHTAALYAARANLAPLVFEGELSRDILPGGQLMTTTEIENFPGFPEGVTGPKLMDNLRAQTLRFGANILPRTVTALDLSRRPFVVMSGEDRWETKALIIATGATAKYLGLPSEEKYLNRGVSACATCDGALPRFRNKPLVVVGGGDTAMEEALFLTAFASQVHVVHRRDQFRASKIMGDRVMKHPKIVVEWNSIPDEVLGTDAEGVTGVRLKDVRTGETREIACVGYFAAIGHKPNSDLVAGALDMDEQGYLKTVPGSSRTNIEGVFAAGDVQDKVYRQAITAAGSGCMAAIDCTRWLESQEG
ncbi:MAG TPA: thioredoxin-disulfide reductase [Candidatus Hydrogenedentes bacterium]|nr:thioredoxin-disulfide reductase [Candidatus Hydrogenedentota bacterium]